MTLLFLAILMSTAIFIAISALYNAIYAAMYALATQIATAIMNFFLAIMITGCIFGMGMLTIALHSN